MGEPDDLLFGMLARGDVRNGAHRAAVRQQGLVEFEHGASRRGALINRVLGNRLIHRKQIADLRTERLIMVAAAEGVGKPEQLDCLVVDHRHMVGGVGHDDALPHVIERHFEFTRLLACLRLAAAQVIADAVETDLVADTSDHCDQDQNRPDRCDGQIGHIIASETLEDVVLGKADRHEQRKPFRDPV